jgi:UPF0176 protein
VENASQIAVLSFYSFTDIPEPEILLPKILLIGKKKYIKGTVLIAQEGFNGSISGPKDTVQLLLEEIIKLTNAKDINSKVNFCDSHPFQKLKVKLKKEIVAMDVGQLDIENLKGTYIEPNDWDDFLKQEDVFLVDTRNDYEVEVGTFKDAIDPKITTFKQLPKWLEQNKQLFDQKKVAMYCTGGIRCEKSTAFLKKLGFTDVYHLKGGILQYLEDTKNQNNCWQGECFVFDDRRAVANDLSPAEGHWLERKQNA